MEINVRFVFRLESHAILPYKLLMNIFISNMTTSSRLEVINFVGEKKHLCWLKKGNSIEIICHCLLVEDFCIMLASLLLVPASWRTFVVAYSRLGVLASWHTCVLAYLLLGVLARISVRVHSSWRTGVLVYLRLAYWHLGELASGARTF